MKRGIIEDPINIGAWRSLEARLLWEQEVPSSNLGAPTNDFNNLGFSLERPFLFLRGCFLPYLFPTRGIIFLDNHLCNSLRTLSANTGQRTIPWF